MVSLSLLQGDCLDILPTLPDKCADAIITDLPYGTTACKWDVIIPLDEMWKQVKRLLKRKGAFVTTSMQPFTSTLIMSNPIWFKYEWIWRKSHAANFMNAKHMPLMKHENILVFCGSATVYNPQITKGVRKLNRSGAKLYDRKDGSIYDSKPAILANVESYDYQPISILEYSAGARMNMEHPTQKPVALYEYLIKTYTNPGDTVLDFCFGSGTTGVACVKTGRNFIGIEKERNYFEIAERRTTDAQLEMAMDFTNA